MFSENLYNFRKQQGYSQEQLAERLGVSRLTIYNWESGTSYPDVDKLIELSELMGCTIDELIRERITFYNQNLSEGDSPHRTHANRIYRVLALGISIALFLLFMGVSLFLHLYFQESRNETVAYTVLSIPIVIAILMIIYTTLQFNAFHKTKTEPSIIYPKAEREVFYRRYSLYLTIGIGLILVGGIVIIINNKTIAQRIVWPLSLGLIVIGFGSSVISYYSIQLSKYSKLRERKLSKSEALNEKISSIIILMATLIFLLSGLIWNLWHIAWIVYIIAGILSQIIYILTNQD